MSSTDCSEIVHRVDAHWGKPFDVPSNVPWIQTSLPCKTGRWYRIRAEASPDYQDKTIRCTADGPVGWMGGLFGYFGRAPGSLSPLRYISGLGVTKRLRVLRDETPERRRASFLTLIACIGMNDSGRDVVVIGTAREFQATRDGEFWLFANDWPGGVGLAGEDRFRNPNATGCEALPTYGNNQGHLAVTVDELPLSHQPDSSQP
jgi:hypothetical protein